MQTPESPWEQHQEERQPSWPIPRGSSHADRVFCLRHTEQTQNPDFSHHWLHAEKRQWSSVAAFEASNGFVVRKASQGRAQSCGRAVKFWRQRHPPRPSIPSSAGAQAHSLWATANTWVGEATTSHDVQGQRAGRHIGTLETDPGKTPP